MEIYGGSAIVKKKDLIIISVLSVIIGFMYLSCLPLGLLDIKFADIGKGTIAWSLNMLLCILIVFLTFKIFKVDFKLGFTKNGLVNGLKNNVVVALIMIFVFAVAQFTNSYSLLGNTPSIARIIIEGILMYIIVGVMEELLLRGLVLNMFEGFFQKSKHKVLIAIIVSSVLFALGHVPAVLNLGIGIILFKFFYPLSTGIYFGYLYKKSNNILVPIIYHAILDIVMGLIMICEATPADSYKTAMVAIISVFSVFLCAYGIIATVKLDREQQISLDRAD